MSRPATASKKSGRPAVLGPAVADRLREAIVTGRWLPGTRLPTRRELGATFDCSTITLQMAMDMLASERFIRSDGRHGTFVAERPPHLTDIAVVFPRRPSRRTISGWPSTIPSNTPRSATMRFRAGTK